MRRSILATTAFIATNLSLSFAAKPQMRPGILELWRLDCGAIELSDSAPYSDGHLYDGQPRDMTDSCYLIRDGERYMLWDAGLPASLIDGPLTFGVHTISLHATLEDQLNEIGLAPADITFVGLSHYHFDHVGQAPVFANATLLINRRDFEYVQSGADKDASKGLAPWLSDTKRVKMNERDLDVFGDGLVTILFTPGHTPGHSSLLIRLPRMGNVLLSGDAVHFREQIDNRGVPTFNTNRADTLASIDRLEQISNSINAKLIIQHDPRDIGLLPQFPESAK
ncbi:MAG: N-acyl homoserine lactonase family protein [Parvularculaceae bacterium]